MSILSRIREFFNKPVIGPDVPWYYTPDVTVKKGDTLSGIAKRYLGDGNRWREIYDLNRAAIGNNPDKIFPGTVLMLPRKSRP